ncbi:MAG TPA: hemolysin family protein [Gemmatimonadaceae bacterium]|nr:hemolysin family protein [Gemmatimonadaceae bacterium]
MMLNTAGSAEGIAVGAGLEAGTRLGLVALLVLANGLFVAAEFGLSALRRGPGESALRKGGGARMVRNALVYIDRYVTATRLGIALSSVALAWIAEPVVAGFLNRLFASIGLQPPGVISHGFAIIGLAVLVAWFLRVLVIRSHGIAADKAAAEATGGVVDFRDKRARDVMRPRTEIVALAEDASEEEVWKTVRTERYSRYPVYRDGLDDLVGVFLAKDLWLHPDTKPFVLREYVRPAVYVPDNRPAERVLEDLRKRRGHLAIVLDEYAGTAGIVTLEDLIEEVIGDINDEYDFNTRQAVESNGVLELQGSISLMDVRSEYQLLIPEGDWNTLGGFVFAQLGRVPRIGDRVRFPGGDLEVVAMDGRRVAAVRVIVTGDGNNSGLQPRAPRQSVETAAVRTAESPRPEAATRTLTDREVPL